MPGKHPLNDIAYHRGTTATELCRAVFEEHGGNLSRASRALGVHRNSIRNQLKKLPVPLVEITQEEIVGGYRKIPLSSGDFTLVDEGDYDWLMQWHWSIALNKSVKRSTRDGRENHSVIMARQIMNPPDDMQVDHINGNRLDNRRCNLRICSGQQNKYNRRKPSGNHTSQYKGVYLNSQNKRWTVQVYANKKRVFVGKFATELEAAHAYDEAARKYHGEFARLNFPNAPATRDEGQAQP